MYRRLFVLMLLVVSLVSVVSAQQVPISPVDGDEVDPDGNITFPPPVYVLRGDVEVLGSANIEDLSNYFIEFRPLEVIVEDDEAIDEEEDEEEAPQWSPITLPENDPVQEGVLGTWNTETAPDGLYEIRLTMNRVGQPATFFVVSPLRVENDAPEFVDVLPTPTELPATRPTLAPTPTQPDTTPTATANLNANVRAGDSTDFRRIGFLEDGESARIIGISSTGSGWYNIVLPNGDRGWISPSVVSVSGNLRVVPRIAPPPPPFTPTPVPTNTPIAQGNLAGSPPSLTPAQPVCGQQFQVLANITNAGTARTTGAATVTIQDIRAATGEVQATITDAVPELEPGENYVVGGNLTISTFYNEEHRIVVNIDSSNAVVETNENDNILTTTYTLQQGTCP